MRVWLDHTHTIIEGRFRRKISLRTVKTQNYLLSILLLLAAGEGDAFEDPQVGFFYSGCGDLGVTLSMASWER